MSVAGISFGELLLLVLAVFYFVAWFWILFVIISDLLRDHESSGVAKAVWVFFLIFLPVLGALLYVIVRGKGMRERRIKAHAESKAESNGYVREQAHAGAKLPA